MEIKVYHQIMDWNQDVSDQVKETLKEHHTVLINIMGSPGAGKTSLIKNIIEQLRDTFSIGVIEGDITTDIDAKTIAEMNVPSVELNLLVENIGNLVCPAEFDIGENMRITILSVPEGDDKVVKYPLMFTDTDCLVINKIDVLPYFDFDLERVQNDYHGINPNAPFFSVSTKDKKGLNEFIDHLKERIEQMLHEAS